MQESHQLRIREIVSKIATMTTKISQWPRALQQTFIDSSCEAEERSCQSWVGAAGQPCRPCPLLDRQNLQTDAPEKTNMRMLLLASIGKKVYTF